MKALLLGVSVLLMTACSGSRNYIVENETDVSAVEYAIEQLQDVYPAEISVNGKGSYDETWTVKRLPAGYTFFDGIVLCNGALGRTIRDEKLIVIGDCSGKKVSKEQVTIHEVGHSFGLEHPNNDGVMNPRKHTFDFTDDDLAKVRGKYE